MISCGTAGVVVVRQNREPPEPGVPAAARWALCGFAALPIP